MGASVGPYWPGMPAELTEEQFDSYPGFYNDSKAWGNWMAAGISEPRVLEALRKLKAEAILTGITEGVMEEEVDWVTPQELRAATQKLGEAVRARLPETKIVLEIYQRAASWVDSVEEHFLRDLADIEAITFWAEEMGATKMTLEVNW